MPVQKAQPVHEIRLGAIKATIWENETEVGTRHNVTVFRLFKEGGRLETNNQFRTRRSPTSGKSR